MTDLVVPRKVTGLSVEGQYGSEDLLDPAWGGIVLEEVDGIFDATVDGIRQTGSIVVGVIPAGSATFEDNWARAERLFSPGERVRLVVKTVASTRHRRWVIGDVRLNDPLDYSRRSGYRSIRVEMTSIDSYWYPMRPYHQVEMAVTDTGAVSRPRALEMPPTGIPTIDWVMPEYDPVDTGGEDFKGTVRPVVLSLREKGASEWKEVVVGHPADIPGGQVVLTTDPSKTPLTIQRVPTPKAARSHTLSNAAPRSSRTHEVKAERSPVWDTPSRTPLTVVARSYGRHRFPW